MAVRGAAVLDPVFRREHGRKGRLSVQVDPTLYRDADAMVAHAVRLASLAPNVQVKLPATAAGIRAIEEATRRGVNVNATVSFTVSQAIAVAEAIERGLDRRAETGLPVADMTPVCTIMVGRLDDWIQVLCERDGIVADPAHVARAGVAAFKKAYGIFRQRGFRTRLLAAAYRHQLHWTEFVGADVVLTMPSPWQKRFNASGIEPVPRIDEPVDPAALAALYARFPDFRRAYDEDGMTVQQFDSFGPTVRTLRTFIASYHELQGLIRDFVLPDPDKAMA
jgi:transaldolase